MAITNAQQYQQLVNKRADGKRPGYRGPGGYQGGRSDTPAGAAQAGSVDRGGGNTNRERAITQQYKGPKGTTGDIRGSGADPKPPTEIIAGKEFPVNPRTPEEQEQKNFAISIENDRKRTAARKEKLKEIAFLENLGKLGYTRRTKDTNLVDLGVIDPQTPTIGGYAVPSFYTGVPAAFTVDPATDYFDIDSPREIGSTLTNTTGGITGTQAATLGDLRQDIQMEDRLNDPTDTVTQSEFEEYMNRNKVTLPEGGGRDDSYYIPPVVSPVVEPEEEIDPNSLQGLLANRVAYRFMADGGRAAYQDGSLAPIAPKVDPRMARSLQENVATNEAQRTANITRKEAQRKAIEDIRNAISSGGKEGLGSFLKQQFGVANPSQVPGYSSYSSPLTGVSSFAKDRITNALIQNYLNPSAQGSGTYGASFENSPYASMFVQTEGGMFNPYDVSSAVQSGYGVMLDGNLYKSEKDAIDALGIERYNQLMADGGRVGLMGGGMPDDFIGGLADGNLDEMGRQMYGLGKLVKKATRAVKKIVKSPVGKAALAFGMYKFGAPLFKSEGFKNFFLKDASKKFAFDNLSSKGILAGIGGISALSGLMSKPEEDDQEETYYRGPGLDIDAIRRNPYGSKGSAYGFYAEGGDVKEPVAKDTMPLLDMDGMEKDYRADGGFVPIGRMERADDVPARLSKNEFVFTADAVRNAGDGDVDKGAEVMYNMMKNLESGGKVSEESQGLDGARDMFQTSKRLEEVL